MEWNEIKRVAVVMAHPDDAEFGVAGTVARMTSESKCVVYVIVTDGSKGSSDPEMTPEALTAIRKAEQREAARIAGVGEVAFLDFPDGTLEPTIELRKALSGAIRRYKPDVVICQNPIRDLAVAAGAQHPDHLAAAEATLAAVYPCARDRMTFPELLDEGLEPHAVREVWVSGTSTPDHYIDITRSIDTKIEALLAHRSQVNPDRVIHMVRERSRNWGAQHGMEYAEAFKRLQMP